MGNEPAANMSRMPAHGCTQKSLAAKRYHNSLRTVYDYCVYKTRRPHGRISMPIFSTIDITEVKKRRATRLWKYFAEIFRKPPVFFFVPPPPPPV